MKNIIFLFLALLAFTHCEAQYWKKVTSGTHKKLLSVSFGNAQTGYISGADSLILKSTDGGATWLPLVFTGINFRASEKDIVDINFVDSLVGFATVNTLDTPLYSGTIYKTKDAGATWFNISSGYMVCTKTFFFNEYNGYQVGSAYFSGSNVSKYSGSVLVAPSWGELNRFSSNPNEYLHAIDFRDTNTGIVGGDNGYVYRTFDAGRSWDTVKTYSDTTINELLYLNDSTIFAATNNTANTLIVSKDKGKTWTYDASSPTFYYPAMKAMINTDADSLVIVGHSSTTGKGLIYDFQGSKTMNITAAEQNLNDVNKATRAIVFIVGDSGLILSNRASKLSIENTTFAKQKFNIFPNPTTGELNTEMDALHQVSIFDVFGKKILASNTFTKHHQFYLAAFGSGIYFVQLISQEGAILNAKVLVY